jgi:hypothetical protein
MKNAESQLRTVLTESLQLSLAGLNQKHTKKLQKTIARAVKQLTRRYTKLVAKELKGHQKASPELAASATAAVRAPRARARRSTAHIAA